MRFNNWPYRIALLVGLGSFCIFQNALANPFPWIDDADLWWNTDASTPKAVEESNYGTISRDVIATDSICTWVYIAESDAPQGIEVRVQKNNLLWYSAHWGDIVPDDVNSVYVGALPSGDISMQRLQLELAALIPDGINSGDTVSASSWAMHYGDGRTEVWWGDCAFNDIAPVIILHTPQNIRIEQGEPFVDPVTCESPAGLSCDITVQGYVDTNASAGSAFTLIYTAADSAGNAARDKVRGVQIVAPGTLDIFPWLSNSPYWWDTDPSVPADLIQQDVENYEYAVTAGDAICTHVEFPYDADPVTGIEVRLLVDDGASMQWVSAHWGSNPPTVTPLTSGSQYRTSVPPADNAFHKLVVDLNGGLSDSSGNSVVIGAGDTISGAAWAAYRAAGLTEVWWDTCTASKEEIGPEITFPDGNPYRIMSTDAIDLSSLYVCQDNIDGACTATIDAAGLAASGGNLEGTYEASYSATDSHGNTTVAVLKVVVDDTPPTLTVLDDNPFYVKLGDAYVDPTPPVVCDNDGIDCVDLVVSNAAAVVNTSEIGLYTVTYTYQWTQNYPISVTRDVIVRHEQRFEAEHAALHHNGGMQSSSIETITSPTVSNGQSVLYPFSGQGSVWWTVDMPTEAPTPDSSYEIIVGYSVNYPVDGVVDVIINEGTADQQIYAGLVLPFNGVLHQEINTARVEVPLHFDLNAGTNTIKLLDQTQIPGVRIDYIDLAFDDLRVQNGSNDYVSINEWDDVHPPEITLSGGNSIILNMGDPYTELGYFCIDDVDGICTDDVVATAWQDYPSTQGTVDFSVEGQYDMVYALTDNNGNEGVVVRQVTVLDSPDGVTYGRLSYELWEFRDPGGADPRTSVTLTRAALEPWNPGPEVVPTFSAELSSFESDSSVHTGYAYHGERLHGYITPRVSGTHKFFVSGNKDVELYINLNRPMKGDSVAELTKVAEMVDDPNEPGPNNSNKWYTANNYDWYRVNSSSSLIDVNLIAGTTYYIAAITRSIYNGNPTEKMTQVAWQEPAGGEQTLPPVAGSNANVIPGSVLAPWAPLDPTDPRTFLPDAAPEIALVTPNPLEHGENVLYDPVSDATCTDAEGPCTITISDFGTPIFDVNSPAVGDYSITLKATDSAGNEVSVQRVITVVANPLPVTTGGLTYEWFNTGGAGKRSHFTYNAEQLYPFWSGGTEADEHIADISAVVSSFESSSSVHSGLGTHGERLHGYITPNVTGVHEFYVSGNKDVELYINYDENGNGSPTTARGPMAELTMVAEMVQGNGLNGDGNSFYHWYSPNDYDWFRDGQASLKQVYLEEGKVYYIAAIARSVCCRNPTDKVQVAWKEPAGGTQTAMPVTGSGTNVIPGSVLAEYVFIDAPPTISLNSQEPLAHAAGTVYVDPATCTDDVDASCLMDVAEFDWGGMNKDNPLAGSYIVTLKTAADSAGNVGTATRTVDVGTGIAYGSLSREFYLGIGGANVNNFKFHDKYINGLPDEVGYFSATDFHYEDTRSSYGAQTHGYFYPPETGNYTFYIAGDDQVELYLDTRGASFTDQLDLDRIAFVPFNGWTNVDQWDKWVGKQNSSPKTLQAGEVYYIRVMHKQGGGGGHVSVGWALDADSGAANDIPLQRIPLNHFSPLN